VSSRAQRRDDGRDAGVFRDALLLVGASAALASASRLRVAGKPERSQPMNPVERRLLGGSILGHRLRRVSRLLPPQAEKRKPFRSRRFFGGGV